MPSDGTIFVVETRDDFSGYSALVGIDAATQGTSKLYFNGHDAGTATSWGPAQIVVNVPSGATTSPVVPATDY